MFERHLKRSGFTLIELLIVVAIIAILAAIAVPNFLEAQSRAKVSRCRSDLRSIAIAIESYIVDQNVPPLAMRNEDWNGNGCQCDRGWTASCVALSTPIAYLSNVDFKDPFCPVKYYNNETGARAAQTYQYNNACLLRKGYVAPSGKVWAPSTDSNIRRATQFYTVLSVGPDYVLGPNPFTGGAWLNAGYAGLDNKGTSQFEAWQYDPSNGTVSQGDIIRNTR
jgi:prepilin-type N-terminal cleavage/methylation domain-containing protein